MAFLLRAEKTIADSSGIIHVPSDIEASVTLDIWSFGVSLYYALRGVALFEVCRCCLCVESRDVFEV